MSSDKSTCDLEPFRQSLVSYLDDCSGDIKSIIDSLEEDGYDFYDRVDSIVIYVMELAICRKKYQKFFDIWCNYVPSMSPDYVEDLLRPMASSKEGRDLLNKIDDRGLLREYHTSIEDITNNPEDVIFKDVISLSKENSTHGIEVEMVTDDTSDNLPLLKDVIKKMFMKAIEDRSYQEVFNDNITYCLRLTSDTTTLMVSPDDSIDTQLKLLMKL